MFDRSPDSRRSDRGVSEVLAFILVFSIIIGSVTVVTVIGFQSMTSYQEGEQLRNAERAMDSLSDNLNDVLRYDGITDRSGELNLRDGSITNRHEGTELEIEIPGEPTRTNTTGGLVYEAGGGTDTIAYEGGGIFRGDHTGNVTLERPAIRCTDDAAIISLLVIEEGERSVASSDAREITISETDATRKAYRFAGDETVTIEIANSEYQNGWEQALERNGWDVNSGVATCEDVDRATVQIVTVEMDF